MLITNQDVVMSDSVHTKSNDSTTECSNYERLEKLGEGTYGIVYKAKDNITGEVYNFTTYHLLFQIVALKKIRLEHADEGVPSTALREITLLKELNHKNIVQLKDIVCGESKLYLVFEYFNLDLKKYLDVNGGPLTAPNVKILLK